MIGGEPLHAVQRQPAEIVRLHVQRKDERHGHDHGAAGRDQTAQAGKRGVDVGDMFEHFGAEDDRISVRGAGASSSVLRMSTERVLF